VIDPSTLPNRPDRTHWAIFGALVEEVAVLPRGVARFANVGLGSFSGTFIDGGALPYVLTKRHHGRRSWRLPRDLFASFEDAMSAWQDCNRALPRRHRKAEPTVVHLSDHELACFAGIGERKSNTIRWY